MLYRRNPLPFIAVGLSGAVLSAVLAIATSVDPAIGPPISGLIAQANLSDRAIGSFGNPNYFGTFQAVATITAVGWMVNARSTRVRFVLLATAGVLAAALLLSLSRGGMIALAGGLACLVFATGRTRAAVLIGAGLAVASVVLFPAFVDWRLTITAGSATADTFAALAQSDAGRLAAVLAGPQLFLTSPIFGVGWAHYSAMSAQFAGPGVALGAHNWYLSVLAEGGLVGITLWALLLVALVLALRTRRTFPRSMGFGVLGAYAVGSLFLDAPASFQTSALALLVIVAALAGDWPAGIWAPSRKGGVDGLASEEAPSLVAAS